MGDIADRQQHNPDPNNAGCVLTGLEEPGVSFRGQSPVDMFQHVLFIGETAMHEGIAELYGFSVDEVKSRLKEDEKSKSGQIKKLKAENAKLAAELAVWLGFKARAEDAGLVVNL